LSDEILKNAWADDVNSAVKPWVTSPVGQPRLADMIAFLLDVPSDSARLSRQELELRDKKNDYRNMALSFIAQARIRIFLVFF